jgi:hypothetical protein
MSQPDDRAELDRERIAELIASAGPRPEMSRERLDGIRQAARASWRTSLGGRAPEVGAELEQRPGRPSGPKPGTWRWALAASLLAAAVLVGWWVVSGRVASSGGDVEERVAGVVEVAAGVTSGSRAGRSRSLGVGDQLAEGERVEVGAEGGVLTLRLDGGSLRIAAGSTVELVSAHEVDLERGALYFDSGASDGGALAASPALLVRTSWGTVEDVGTQFEVRIAVGTDQGALRIRVREGEVRLSGPGLDEQAARGTELLVSEGGRVARTAVATTGDEWKWVVDSAPPFDRDGRTLGSYLDWLARETGWTIRFEDPSLAGLRSAVMHGPPVRRPDSYRSTLLANGLDGEVVAGELLVHASH